MVIPSPFAARQLLQSLGFQTEADESEHDGGTASYEGPDLDGGTVVVDGVDVDAGAVPAGGLLPVFQVLTRSGTAWVVHPTLTAYLGSYRVTYGRRDARSRTTPVQVALTLAYPYAPVPALGDELRVRIHPEVCVLLGITPAQGVRGTGTVTDVQKPHARGWASVTVVGRRARRGALMIDGTGWPTEQPGDRVERILNAIGQPGGRIDGGGFTEHVAPDRPATADAMLALTELSSLGTVIDQPDDRTEFHSFEARRNPAPLAVPASAYLSAITWTQRVGDLQNLARVKYPGGETVVEHPTSASRHGPYPVEVQTDVPDLVDAARVGALMVGRRGFPSWILPDLTADLTRTVGPALAGDLLAVRFGDAITDPTGAGDVPHLNVEGWTEQATPRSWRLTLSVSDPALSGSAIRWRDALPATQWQDVDPALTWNDAGTIINPTELEA